MESFLKHVKETVEKYGFRAEIVKEIEVTTRDENGRFVNRTIKNPSVCVYAKNIDGKEVKWFEYNSNENKFHGNDTDVCNIWLYRTRKDLKPDDLVSMFCDIEADMKVLVDSEDWQKLANVPDTFEDI